jgi:hypothetical protein
MRSRRFVLAYTLIFVALISSALTAFAQSGNESQVPEFARSRTGSNMQRQTIWQSQRQSPGSQQLQESDISSAVTANAAGSRPNFAGFYAAPLYNAGVVNTSVIVEGDFNNDGKPDVAMIGSEGIVGVLLNDGTGGFKAPIISRPNNFGSYGFNIEQIDEAIAVDLNGDGYFDLVWTPSSNTNIAGFPFLVVLLNQKDGTFSQPTLLSFTGPSSSNTGTVVFLRHRQDDGLRSSGHRLHRRTLPRPKQ